MSPSRTKSTTPSFHLHIDRSETTGGLEILATATLDGQKLPEVTEAFIAPDLTLPAGMSVRAQQEELGMRLWRSAFPGRVARLLAELRDKLGRRTCFLRLTFGRALKERSRLEKLPWELLCDPDSRSFLGLSRKFVLVRTAETIQACPPLEGAGPLRILVASASPKGMHSAKPESEIAEIQRIWRDHAHVFVMPEADLGSFRRKVADLDRNGGIHIVQFIGHGGTLAGHDQGLVVFNRSAEEQDAACISAAQLADQLAGLDSLRLVVLNACHTFEPPELPTGEPWRSVALELAARGVPAVIGTSCAISIDLATRFSTNLHEALAEGRTIHEAVCEARLALKPQSNDGIDHHSGFYEWTTPVLYLTAPDGDLLRFAEPDEEKRPLHLGICSRKDPRRAGRLEADHVLDLVPLFDGRDPKYSGTWEAALTRLWGFTSDHCGHELPLKITFEAHLSLAFAAGYLLHRCAAEITLDQLSSWRSNPDAAPWDPEDLWQFTSIDSLERVNQGDGKEELAVAVSVGRDTMPGVEAFCLGERGKRWNGLHAMVRPEIGLASVQGDAHCAALAKALVDQATRRAGRRDVHLFMAVPVSLAFQIGRLATSLGTIHLYEYDFGGKKGYSPSLMLTPTDQERPREPGKSD